MKKIIIMLIAMFTILSSVSLFAASTPENMVGEEKATYIVASANFSTCDDQRTTKEFRGGTITYGCDTFANNEAYTDYYRSGPDPYSAYVKSGDTYYDYGPVRDYGSTSSAQVPFYSGNQQYGIED